MQKYFYEMVSEALPVSSLVAGSNQEALDRVFTLANELRDKVKAVYYEAAPDLLVAIYLEGSNGY